MFTRAIRYAKCCSAVHSAPAVAEIILTDLGYTYARIDNKETSTTCYVLKGNGETVVVFKASKELRDWITNLKAIQTAMGWLHPGQAHIGFQEAFASVMHDLRVKLMEPKYEGPIKFVGHSLGGALAQLAGSYYADSDVSVTTFGSPRVFDKAAAKLFDESVESYRYEVAGDAISRMPPRSLMDYRHVGKHYYLTEDGVITDPSQFTQLRYNIKDLISEFINGEWASFEDHKMTLYIKRLLACQSA